MTQYVRVEVAEGRAYTYEWDDVVEELAKGDVVVLPSNMVKDREFTGRVVRLLDGPDTDFPLKQILRRAEPAKKAAEPEEEDWSDLL